MDLSSSLTLQPTSAFSSVHIVGSLISKLPSLNIELPFNLGHPRSAASCHISPNGQIWCACTCLKCRTSIIYTYTHINLQDKLQCQSGDVWPQLPELTPRCHGCAQRGVYTAEAANAAMSPATSCDCHVPWLKYGTWLSCWESLQWVYIYINQ